MMRRLIWSARADSAGAATGDGAEDDAERVEKTIRMLIYFSEFEEWRAFSEQLLGRAAGGDLDPFHPVERTLWPQLGPKRRGDDPGSFGEVGEVVLEAVDASLVGCVDLYST